MEARFVALDRVGDLIDWHETRRVIAMAVAARAD
jgi:hypothetical protein